MKTTLAEPNTKRHTPKHITIRLLPPKQNHLWVTELGPDDQVIVAEDRGRLCALACLKSFREPEATTGRVGIFVMTSYRNHGIGRRLLGTLLELADQQLRLDSTFLTVELDNAAALHLYESLGFEPAHRTEEPPLCVDIPGPVVRMVRARPDV